MDRVPGDSVEFSLEEVSEDIWRLEAEDSDGVAWSVRFATGDLPALSSLFDRAMELVEGVPEDGYPGGEPEQVSMFGGDCG